MAYQPISESAALQHIRQHLDNAAIMFASGSKESGQSSLREARRILDQMDAQVSAGIHRNPLLVTFNPPQEVRGQVKIASDVQGILYRHAQKREFFFHSFGGEVDFRNMRDGSVVIDELPERTGVEAFLIRDTDNRKVARAAIIRHNRGLPIAEDV